jgi:hypothetical protein
MDEQDLGDNSILRNLDDDIDDNAQMPSDGEEDADEDPEMLAELEKK